MSEFKGWYCAHCECGVDSSDVTFNEAHTVCGRIITDDEPPAPTNRPQIVADLVDALNCLLEQTVDQALAEGIELTEGEMDARQKAIRAIEKAGGAE